MNRKLKVITSVIVIAMIIMISTMVSAYSVGINLSSSSKLKAGETVTVTVNLGTIDAGNGINTITAELSYDKNVFETLATSNITANNEWTPTYAANTNMLTLTKASKVKTGESVLTINLKVKNTISVNSTTINLGDIVVSGGKVQDGGTGDIDVNSTSITINANSSATTTTEPTNTNTSTQTNSTTKKNTTIKDNTVTTKKTLPKTGIGQYSIIAILVIAIVGIFSYILYKKTSKEVK